MYNGEFDKWEDVRIAFSERYGEPAPEVPEQEPPGLIVADYDIDGYEGDAGILWKDGDGYKYVQGSHCSCYGLEGQWEPEAYTEEQLLGQLERAAYGFFKRNKDAIKAAI